MEEFGWIVILGLVWLFSTIGEWRKAQAKRRRRERDTEDVGSSGPAGLAADVAEGARRAEDALRRWEARQRAASRAERAPERRPQRAGRPADRWREAGQRIAGTAGSHASRTADREASEQRREAYEAIADLLAERDERAPLRPEIGAEEGQLRASPSGASRPSRPAATGATSAMPLARSTPLGRSGVGPPRARSAPGGSGLARLDRLPVLQRAIVLRELLGPPKAISPDPDARW